MNPLNINVSVSEREREREKMHGFLSLIFELKWVVTQVEEVEKQLFPRTAGADDKSLYEAEEENEQLSPVSVLDAPFTEEEEEVDEEEEEEDDDGDGDGCLHEFEHSLATVQSTYTLPLSLGFLVVTCLYRPFTECYICIYVYHLLTIKRIGLGRAAPLYNVQYIYNHACNVRCVGGEQDPM